MSLRTAARNFRMIDDAGQAIIVRYRPDPARESPVEQWLAMLEADAGQRWIYRKLQRYSVNLHDTLFNALLVAGYLKEIAGQFVLMDCHYDRDTGVKQPDALLDAGSSIIS